MPSFVTQSVPRLKKMTRFSHPIPIMIDLGYRQSGKKTMRYFVPKPLWIWIVTVLWCCSYFVPPEARKKDKSTSCCVLSLYPPKWESWRRTWIIRSSKWESGASLESGQVGRQGGRQKPQNCLFIQISKSLPSQVFDLGDQVVGGKEDFSLSPFLRCARRS